jgi:hypothetical protein
MLIAHASGSVSPEPLSEVSGMTRPLKTVADPTYRPSLPPLSLMPSRLKINRVAVNAIINVVTVTIMSLFLLPVDTPFIRAF